MRPFLEREPEAVLRKERFARLWPISHRRANQKMELDKTPTTCNRALGLWVQGWLAGGLAVGLAGWLAGYIPTCLRRPRRFHHWRDVIVAARSKRAPTEVPRMRVQQ